jgi:3-oxoacyl-[acyl-carrier protein] reductase
MKFKDRVSIITGASQGIGEAIALSLSRAGAYTVLIDIQKDKARQVADKIEAAGGQASVYEVDVSDLKQVSRAVEEIEKKHGAIHHLVNNAGITRDTLFMRMKEEDWDAVISVNLKGVFNFTHAVIRKMMSSRYGRIVNISSVVGLMGNVGQANYAAAKAGVIGFTKTLAREAATRNVTVNAVAPGYIATAMTDCLADNIKQAFLDLIPMKRFGQPEEVAHVVKYLLSDEAAYITGQVININGGMYM